MMMEDPDTDLFSLDSAWSEALYLELDCDDSSDCPPPLWALPPPPRPPWLSEPEPGQDSCSDSGSEFESCENILILDTGAGIQHTFHNLVIIAVCSAILVILLVFLVACIWRWRHYRAGGCHCGTKPGQSSEPGVSQAMELSDNMAGAPGNPVTSYSEVYDNPNYSHIMIGGQPFFILPSGELSDHVPVPGAAEAVPVTPGLTQAQARHIYEPGSSTYRSTSDYDTDSSTYRPDSDRGQAPIYEEIDRDLELRLRGLSPCNTVAVVSREAPGSVASVHTRLERPPPPWASSGTKSLSPRRPPASRAHHQGPGSIYYYSDTLRGRKGDTRDTTESDSGISGEGTPHHGPGQPRVRARLGPGALEAHTEVQTQVFLASLTAREKRGAVKL